MNEVNELDLAELRVQMRQMYRQIGFAGAMRCLHEILISGQVLIEVILEEI